jgi:hypothetical protein
MIFTGADVLVAGVAALSAMRLLRRRDADPVSHGVPSKVL